MEVQALQSMLLRRQEYQVGNIYLSDISKNEGFTKALSAEWASKGIKVNAISPGYVDTHINE